MAARKAAVAKPAESVEPDVEDVAPEGEQPEPEPEVQAEPAPEPEPEASEEAPESEPDTERPPRFATPDGTLIDLTPREPSRSVQSGQDPTGVLAGFNFPGEELMTSLAPLVRHFYIQAPAVATAGNDDTAPGLIVPFAGTVSAVEFIAKTTLTGAATNYRSHTLVNKGAAGSGTTAVATLAYSSTGVVATALVPKSITLSATAADLVVAAGDVLQWKSDHTASGLADPGGIVRVTVTRS